MDEDGAKLVVRGSKKNKRKLFRFIQAPDNSFFITVRYNKKYLSIRNDSKDDGAPVVQSASERKASREFRLKKAGDYYHIVNAHSGKCLEVSTKWWESRVVKQRVLANKDAQKFKLVKPKE